MWSNQEKWVECQEYRSLGTSDYCIPVILDQCQHTAWVEIKVPQIDYFFLNDL